MATDPAGDSRRARGAHIEALAAAFLRERGLLPVAANANARGGELDLVMRDGETLVFVEVRYRRDARFGGGAASVDAGKRRRIVLAAEHFLAAHRARIAAGETVGPRIIANGFIEGRSPYSTRGGFVVDSLEKAREAVDWYAARGFRQLKLYNSFRPEWVQPLAEYAHARGLRVGGHVPAFMRAEEAVRAGYDELHHANQVLLNFLVRPGDDTRTLVRFYRVADGAATLDLNSPAVLDFVKLLRERGTVVDPTLTVHEDMFTHRQGTVDPSYAAVFEHVPVELQRNWRRNSMNVNAGNAGLYRLSYDQIAAFVAQLHRAGVPLVAGTDDISGFTLHRELELYVQAGIPANEVLRIATWNGAKYTQTLADSGSVTPGKRADLVLVEGNPLEDISAIRRISMVVQDGAVYFPAELYEALGVRRFVDPPALASVPAPAG